MNQPPHNSDSQESDVNLPLLEEAKNFTIENTIDGNQNQALQGNGNKSVQGNANTVNQGNKNLNNIKANQIYNIGQLNINSINSTNSAQTPIFRSQETSNKSKAEFVLTGSIDSINETKLKVIVEHLRKLANDLDITIIKVEEGSIKIIFEGSPEGIKRLEKLFKSGKLTELSDFPIEDFHSIALNFSRQNLRGRSFKGQNLAGANFSGADIRGADFSGANLRGANFSHATAGLQKRWIIILILSALLVSILSAFVSVFGSAQTPNSVFTVIPEPYINIRYLTLLAQAGVLFLLTVGWGFQRALEAGAIIPVITWSITKVLAISGIISSTKVVLAIQSGILGGAVIGTWVLAITGVMTIAGSVLIAITTIHRKLTDMILVGAITITSAGVGILSITGFNFKTIIITGSGIIIAACLTVYVSWHILVRDDKFSWIWALAVNLASTGGTSFRYADLSNANFARTVLKGTDFRDAILKQTCWSNAQRLDFARVGNSYLKHLQIQHLLVSNNGENQNFDGLNLTDINLSNTKLTDASFIRANLNHANLQNAILLRAKLVQTQLDGTDFTGATLTGAYIEDWNITTDTKFDKVGCEYVYMRLPTSENPDPHRKPDNRQEVFAPGEFGDFIKPIFDTLDLYHNQSVDPRAIAISFKQLAENHPEADLRIVGMEVRGEDKFLLRAKTAAMADKSELSAEYFDTYNQIKGLPEREIKLLLAEKDNQIRRLENMVMTALERPSFYSNVEQVGFMTNNPGGFSVGGSVDGDINNVQGENNQQKVSNKSSSFNLQGAQFAGGVVNADTVNAHQIGGNITNYNPEQKQNLAEAAAEIQQLLNQLSQTYSTATTSQKMSVVAKAVDKIESNPTLKERVIGALKAGGTEAFKELIDHPLVNILLASIEGWQDAE